MRGEAAERSRSLGSSGTLGIGGRAGGTFGGSSRGPRGHHGKVVDATDDAPIAGAEVFSLFEYDDGRVHRSTDSGANWQDVTPQDLPEWLQINDMVFHPHTGGEDGTTGGVYLAATGYKLDDFNPYLYKTEDGGASWQRIDGNIDRQHFTRAVEADPVRSGLLFAGTERGVYVSFDDGGAWHLLEGLPEVPVTDL